MTNLEYYTQTADHLTKTDDIRLYMTNGWLEDWYDSKRDDLLPWLLEEHKDVKDVIIEMLDENVNRMCETNDEEELEEMRYYAKRKIDMIAEINKKRMGVE